MFRDGTRTTTAADCASGWSAGEVQIFLEKNEIIYAQNIIKSGSSKNRMWPLTRHGESPNGKLDGTRNPLINPPSTMAILAITTIVIVAGVIIVNYYVNNDK